MSLILSFTILLIFGNVHPINVSNFRCSVVLVVIGVESLLVIAVVAFVIYKVCRRPRCLQSAESSQLLADYPSKWPASAYPKTNSRLTPVSDLRTHTFTGMVALNMRFPQGVVALPEFGRLHCQEVYDETPERLRFTKQTKQVQLATEVG